MAWQVPMSFNTEEEDFIRDRIAHDSTKELQQKIRKIAKNAVLDGYDEEG